MQTVNSSLVFLGPWPAHWSHLGALNIAYPEDLKSELKPDVAIVKLSHLSLFQSFLELTKKENPFFQVVLVSDEQNVIQPFFELYNQQIFSSILVDPNSQELEATLLSALEKAQTQKQNLNLESLVNEQTVFLERAQKDLEERIEKRSRHLLDSRAKLVQTNLRIESFRKALVAAFRASTVQELEVFLNSSLAEIVRTAWVKIVFDSEAATFEEQMKVELNYNFLRLSLFDNQKEIGFIFFMKPAPLKFTKEERDLLDRVAEAVSLSIFRLHRLHEAQSVKLQWESTFDSISEPLILINDKYEVLQANASFSLVRGKNFEKGMTSKSQKCFELLFKKDSPCFGCVLGESSQVQDSLFRSYEVKSQKIFFESSREPAYVNLYRDITEELLIEQQILDSARRAELGIISSSIAHELNNPLGGMLTFAQLLKMELPATHPFHQDLQDIENGILKCKDIVQNLLNFARVPDVSNSEDFSIQEAVLESVSLVDLQTRAYGISIHKNMPELDLKFYGHRHFLIQALTSLLQRSLNFIVEKKRHFPQHKGLVEISLRKLNSQIALEIRDNSFSADLKLVVNIQQDQLAKAVSQRLVKELGGTLSWESQEDLNVMAKITLPITQNSSKE